MILKDKFLLKKKKNTEHQKSDDRPNSTCSMNDSTINETSKAESEQDNTPDVNQTSATNLILNRANSETTTTLVANSYSNALLFNDVEIKTSNAANNVNNVGNEIPVLFDMNSNANLLENASSNAHNHNDKL